ncbi:GH13169 [Drosophila grimshawi]|uniref:GH13169 n=1 Tax=Drosophila grimshawi TaxID=7222 RepID=B4JQL0_DROGR|nr:GH13169 [Drosophila grimshawi]
MTTNLDQGSTVAVVGATKTIARPSPLAINVPTPLVSIDGQTPPTPNHKSTIVIESQPKRRVSIVSEVPVLGHNSAGYDNLAFDFPHPHFNTFTLWIGAPGRRRSILKDVVSHENECDRVSTNSYEIYKQSALDVLNANYNGLQAVQGVQDNNGNYVEQSWIYNYCLKCRKQEPSESWEPPFWQKVFPYPLCPTFRTFSRLTSLTVIGALLWITSFVIIGKSAGPGGQLFDLVVLTVAANFGGYLISLSTLPRLLGMLLVGLLFQNAGWVDFDGEFSKVIAHLRKFALTIILTRAGLEMNPNAFKKVYKTILKLGIVPWFVEFGVLVLMSHFLLGLPWIWCCMLGSIMAAIAPAVVVPCLFRLRTKGYGVAKGIPTLVVAVSGVDDALSVAAFGIINTIMYSDRGHLYLFAQVPVCIVGGLGFGIVWGSLARIFPERGDAYVVPLRTMMLFIGNLVAIYGSGKLGFEGAGPLAVVFSSFISNYFWCKDGWTIDDNPVGTGFEIFWMIFEPILFGLTGATIKLRELDSNLIYIGAVCIFTGVIVRIFVTAGIAVGDRLNTKEKFFVGLAWMAKATVQAALGPVALRHLDETSTEEDRNWARIVQTICILSILLTAPLGAILISVTGPRMLTKTKQAQALTGWRRPSIRDISIIDEEEEREDPETPTEKQTHDNTQSNAHIPNLSFTLNK